MDRAERNNELFLQGDFDTLYLENEAFLMHICKTYRNLNYELDELMSIARIAFVKTTKTYDPNVSKFTTYLAVLINKEILMFHRANTRKIRDTSDLLYLEQTLSIDEVGKKLTLADIISTKESLEDSLIENSIVERAWELLENLPEKQKQVLKLHMQGVTQREIAERCNISQSYVSRLVVTLGNRIRDRMKKEKYIDE